MPVHNGASRLPRALASVLAQTHQNLEVVVSDNASTDDTPAICRSGAAGDPRIRYVRQAEPISAWENFRYVLEQATGEYFLWTADDDLHSPNYVETLVRALSDRPGAVLAITDMVRFFSDAEPTSGSFAPKPGSPDRQSDTALLRHVIRSPCSEFYGLFRTEALRRFPWTRFDYGPDHILLFYAWLQGDVIYAPGAVFYESIRRVPKPRRERVGQGFYRTMTRFRMVRFGLQMAKVAASAAPTPIPLNRRIRIVAYSYYVLRITFAKAYLYEHAPVGARDVWRRIKPRLPRLDPAP